MFIAGGDNINSCGVDAAVAENIRQLGNILLDTVKGPGKELPQIVGKYLTFLDTGDLIDFVSEANLDAAKKFTSGNDVFFSADYLFGFLFSGS